MNDLEKFQRESYLDQCERVWGALSQLDADYLEKRKKLKKQLANLIEDGKTTSDLKVADVAERLGVERQTIYKIIADIYGVRDLAKSRAGKLGHEIRRKNAQSSTD